MPAVSNIAVKFSQQGADQVKRANDRVQSSISETAKTAKKEERSISKWMQRNKTALMAMGAAMGAVMAGIIKATPALNARLSSTRMGFEFLAMTIGQHLEPVFRWIESFAWKIADAFAALPKPVQRGISVLVAGLAALAVALAAATAAQWALNAAAYANPYVLLAMAIVGLVAALYALETRFGLLTDIWVKVKAGLTALYNAFMSFINLVKGPIIAALNFMKTLFINVFKTIKTIVATAILTIYYLLTGQFGKLRELFRNFGQNIKQIWGGLWKKIKTAFINFATWLYSAVKTAIVKFWKGLIKFITDPSYRKKVVKKAFAIGKNIVQSIIKGIGDIGSKIWSWVQTHIGGFVNKIVKWAEGVMGMSPTLIQIGKSIVQSIIKGIGDIGSKIWDSIKGGLSSVGSKISNFASDAKDWGKDLSNNLADGISDAADAASNAAEGVVGSVSDYLSFDLKMNDRMAQRWGSDWIEEIAKGFSGNIDSLTTGAADAVGATQNIMMDPGGTMTTPAPAATNENNSLNITIEEGAVNISGQTEDIDERRLAEEVARELDRKVGGR